jgi:hypothetical protein
MDNLRGEGAKVLGMMMELFRSFTRVNPVNSDGKVILVTYWTSADAERRYEELNKRYQAYLRQKEE